MKIIPVITLLFVILLPACSDSNDSQTKSRPGDLNTTVAATPAQPAPVEEKSTVQAAADQQQTNATNETWDKTKEITGEAAVKSKEYGAAAVDKTKEVYGSVKQTGAEAGSAIAEKSSEAWDKTKEVTGNVVDKTKEVAGDVVDKTKEVTGEVVDTAKDYGSKAVDTSKEMYKGAKGEVKRSLRKGYRVAAYRTQPKTILTAVYRFNQRFFRAPAECHRWLVVL